MRFAIHGLALAFLLLGLARGPALALDIYAVSGIEVDVSAETAVEARNNAIVEGERVGLARLLKRLTVAEYFDRLPNIENLNIDRFVRSFGVEKESVSSNRYVASLFVAFDGEAVQRELRSLAIPVVLSASDPLLVVPVRIDNGETDFWDEGNPWRNAWSAEAGRNSLLDIQLPLGDLLDVASLKPEMLQSGERAQALERMANRYGAEGVILAAAQVVGENTISIEVIGEHAWRSGVGQMRHQGDLAAPETWREAVRLFVKQVEDNWKRGKLVRADTVASLRVEVPLVDFAEWVQIRKTLADLPEIRGIDLELFSQRRAELTINYIGDRPQLMQKLGARGLRLREDTNRWLLQRAAGPRSG